MRKPGRALPNGWITAGICVGAIVLGVALTFGLASFGAPQPVAQGAAIIVAVIAAAIVGERLKRTPLGPKRAPDTEGS